jgi:ferritin-like metal-binding protein YciE
MNLKHDLMTASQEQPKAIAGMATPHNPNLTERIEMQIAEAKAKLAQLEEVHAELKKNPGIEHLLNLLQRV